MAGDSFAGVCSYHGDCLEGLASGPAVAARAGRPGGEVRDDDPIWEPVIDALAEGCSTLFFTLASQRIVLGGGVINQRHWLIEEIARRSAAKLGGYLPYIEDYAPVVAAELGADAGPRGALLLAEAALGAAA
jgi:fructokinase